MFDKLGASRDLFYIEWHQNEGADLWSNIKVAIDSEFYEQGMTLLPTHEPWKKLGFSSIFFYCTSLLQKRRVGIE